MNNYFIEIVNHSKSLQHPHKIMDHEITSCSQVNPPSPGELEKQVFWTFDLRASHEVRMIRLVMDTLLEGEETPFIAASRSQFFLQKS